MAFASWAFLFPLRAWAVLPKIVRLTGPGARPHRGCHVPHQLRRGGGGCLLYCAAWVPRRAAVKAACLCQTEGAVWFLADSSSRQPSVATTFRNAASTEVHGHSPLPSFPHPVRLDGSGSPWASPVCFRTPRYRGACAGWEPTGALVGAVVTRHRPLIWSDLVSHAPYGMVAEQAAEIVVMLRCGTRNDENGRRARRLCRAGRAPEGGRCTLVP